MARSVLKRRKEPDEDKIFIPSREIENPVTISRRITPYKAHIPSLSDFLKSAKSNNSRADKKEKKLQNIQTSACPTPSEPSLSNSSSTVANITPDTAPLILEKQSSTEETVDASANKSDTFDQMAITSFTSDIHELQYSDSSNNSSCDNSILERMDLLELKLLEAQKDLAEFDGNLNTVSHCILPAMEPLDISISPTMSPIRATVNYRALAMKEQD